MKITSVSIDRVHASREESHIAIIGQMATPYLAFGNTLKTGPLQVVRIHAFLGRHSTINKATEDLARQANDALVFTDPDAELDHALHRVPACIGREAKKHAGLLIGGRPMFAECSNMAMRRSARAVFSADVLPNPLGETGGSDPVANDCFRRHCRRCTAKPPPTGFAPKATFAGPADLCEQAGKQSFDRAAAFVSQDQNRCPKQLNHVTRPAPRYSAINAAIAVATDGRTTATDAIESVANLAEKSFPTTDITGNITHHPLLDTTRVYALEKLTESGEVDDVARRRRRVLPRYVRAGAARCQACRGLDLQP